jgi:hypothetical protein
MWLEIRLRVDIATQKNAPTSADEASLLIAERILRLLASLAKGMQSLSEGPVDLDAVEDVASAPTDERLLMTQNHVMAIITQIHRVFGMSGEVAETICNIFRAGFSETDEGPFVFPPSTVIDFFTHNTATTNPRIGTLISTACSFVSSLSSRPRSQILSSVSTLLLWVLGLLKGLSGKKKFGARLCCWFRVAN